LPLLVAALYRREGSFGRALGLLYGWNTLGAVAGALIGEVVLIEWLGIRGSALAAASLNGIACTCALLLRRRLDETGASAPTAPSAPLPRRAWALLAAAFLAGGILLALEVVWFRFLILFVHGTSFTFAVMLAVVLLGIGLGGLIGSLGIARSAGGQRNVAVVSLFCGVACLAAFASYGAILDGWNIEHSFGWSILFYAAPLMLPVATLSGVLFTLLGDALEHTAPAETRSAGLLALSNTAGAMLGSIVGGFVLVPWLGIGKSIHFLAAAYSLVALCAWLGSEHSARRTARVGGCAALLAAVTLLFPLGRFYEGYLGDKLSELTANGRYELVEIREGLTETIFYLRRSVSGYTLDYKMATNSYNMSATSLLAQRYMKLFVFLPVAIRPEPKSALLISYGVGMTAKALTDTKSLTRIDIVDISRDVLDMNSIVYPDPKDHPLNDPRVEVHIEDGRHFLQTTDRRFDLITGEPPPPVMAGVVSLFTKEFFQLIYSRLNSGGVASYWLPVHVLQPQERAAITAAFCSVFEDCTLWMGAKFDWILLGSAGELPLASKSAFTRQWRDPVVGPWLRNIGIENPAQLGALFMAGKDELAELTAGVSPLEDDRPKQLRAEYGTDDLLKDHRRLVDVKRGRAAFARSEFVSRHWPKALRKETLKWFRTRSAADDFFFQNKTQLAKRIPELHRLLNKTRLQTTPMLLLNTTPDKLRIAQQAADDGIDSAWVHMRLATGALAERRYAEAAARFEGARRANNAPEDALLLRIYALLMAGKTTLAAAHIQNDLMPRHQPGDRHFLEFVTNEFQDTLDRGNPPS